MTLRSTDELVALQLLQCLHHIHYDGEFYLLVGNDTLIGNADKRLDIVHVCKGPSKRS